MKEILRQMSWTNSRGKPNWSEIIFDSFIIVGLGLLVFATYMLSEV